MLIPAQTDFSSDETASSDVNERPASNPPTGPFLHEIERLGWWARVKLHFRYPRIYRATIAATIVQACQTLSGINIVAFLATSFFSSASLRSTTIEEAQLDSYRLAIGFGATNAAFSALAYFLIEKRTEDAPDGFSDASQTELGQMNTNHSAQVADGRSPELPHVRQSPIAEAGIEGSNPSAPTQGASNHASDSSPTADPQSPIVEASLEESDPSAPTHRASDHNSDSSSAADAEREDEETSLYADEKNWQLRGRRFLLLLSLAGGFFTLLITSLLFQIDNNSSARLPLIALFVMLFTMFYSLGIGPIPFLYCE